MARFTQAAWADKMMRATPEARRTMVQELGRRVHEITDDAGQPLDFSHGPTTATVAPPVALERDRSGRMKVKPADPVKTQVESRGEIDMNRFRSQMKIIENFNDEDKKKATKAIYLEHLGIEI